MPALSNPRHERFAQALADGATLIAAHRAAGFRPNRGNAAALKRRHDISQRLQEIAERRAAREERAEARALEVVTIDKAKVLAELAAIAFSDMGDVLDFDGDRLCLRAASAIPLRARRAISSVKVKHYLEGTKAVEVLEFKFWSKDTALEKLGKHLGLWKEDDAPKDLGEFFKALQGNGNGSDKPRVYDA